MLDSDRYFLHSPGGCSAGGHEIAAAEANLSCVSTGHGVGFQMIPFSSGDPRIPLFNLSLLRQKMDSLQEFLSDSVKRNTFIGKNKMDMVSTEISSAIQHVIVNGAALLACYQHQPPDHNLASSQVLEPSGVRPMAGRVPFQPDPLAPGSSLATSSKASDSSYLIAGKVHPKTQPITVETMKGSRSNLTPGTLPTNPDLETPMTISLGSEEMTSTKFSPAISDEGIKTEIDDEGGEIVEIDAVELLAEHIHICDICGKGFKRDANLRMHMRAHGDQFKTPEALAKPDRLAGVKRKIRFSCPFVGCNRNKSHKKFRPLKSAICVKNHFKRSHCPKMYSCNRCNKKSFSVVADLKSHLKHCGEPKWRCTCGTSFSRKDKLFGHMALFEGHMPAVVAEAYEESKEAVVMDDDEDLEDAEEEGEEYEETQLREGDAAASCSGYDLFEDLLDGFVPTDDDSFKDVLGSPSLVAGMDDIFQI
ncbi:PREDICTED: zinc finger protein STOP1 homolog [Nelumbo nucifera]|uniref:Zinc finger protein STOP1 homolog n=1 Tax=Nelumbo nucifera TaxID=4432 RepID=A0A1U8B0E5_NELNU|nr:PREDICTED: zinc finger protein STOP1 homolog [Nelumbo nucifera]